jgi:hypothetical protein
MALERWTEAIGWPAWPTVARNMFSLSQVICVAIVIALVPGRRMAGAAWLLAFYGACFGAESMAGTKHSFSAWASVDVVAAEMTFGLAIFVVMQGFRMFLGWRIIGEDCRAVVKRGQFSLSELTEWMVSWGILLGLVHLSGYMAFASFRRAAQFLVYLMLPLLMGIPIAWLVLRPKLNAASVGWTVAVATCVVPVWMFAQASYVALSSILPLWRQAIWAGCVLWCFLWVHFLGVRWLGYRWQGRPMNIVVGQSAAG